jgi:SAM-dependent methyltransferase
VPLPPVVHDRLVHHRRVARLSRLLADAVPACRTVLDVGCGDGRVSAGLAAQRPELTVEGIDVLVRPDTAVPVSGYDGERIPFEDGGIDVVTMVDVLHHTPEPAALLAEAARVAGLAVVVKDHCRDGWLAGAVLRAMDWAGNAHHGVRRPHTYLSRREWERACRDLGLGIASWRDDLGLYPALVRPVLERRLHFLAVLTP